jgi:hypothetical protein
MENETEKQESQARTARVFGLSVGEYRELAEVLVTGSDGGSPVGAARLDEVLVRFAADIERQRQRLA